MARVELDQIRVGYARAGEVVRGVSLAVDASGSVALIGASGGGKTTLLRVVAGLLRATSGRVLIDGREVTDVPPHARGVGLVSQGAGLYPHLTVRESIEMARRGASGMGTKDAAAALGIEHVLERRAWEVSGGERRRAALARELVRGARVLLLDEPTTALDALARADAHEAILRVRERLGCTLVLVTHDADEAVRLCGHGVVLEGGVVAGAGTLAALRATPPTTLARAFFARARAEDAA
ncbi:MAG: ABC transporter ATP-binding protein [Planctomycetota bacterium]|nr:ABC transporter ATP-binding protein [Planctomycetota bacterium]